jgi:two-component system phosphate regulon sensor histidine kinase PhoR
MNNTEYWFSIVKKIMAVYIPCVIIGAIAGDWEAGLIVALIYHIAWFYRYQKQLYHWLWDDRSLIPPSGKGTWEQIFTGIYKLQRRHRQRRKELASVIKRFREGAEALPDAAVVCKTDGILLWCNKLACTRLGFRWPDDHGQNISNLIRHPSFLKFFRIDNLGEPLVIPSPINDGKILEFRIMPYTDDQILLVVRDVTQVKTIEDVRRNFVANVSHELRTPLTVLSGYLEMMEEQIPPPAQWSKMQKVMHEQTQRMENLVNQLLVLSRIEANSDVVRNTIVDVPQLLSMLHHEAEALSGTKQHVFHFNIDPHLQMYGDEEQIRSAMMNLITNAIKYTPAGKRIEINWRSVGGEARFSVRDEGEGIAIEHINHLTERFYRVDRARSRETGGTGLGLAIVKHALANHDSMLSIESTLGKGSTFSFSIPENLLVKPK